MGFLDKLKEKLGGKPEPTGAVKGPSMVLRENGIDPAPYDIDIAGDGTVTISGPVASDDERQRIVGLLEGIPGVTGVRDLMQASTPAAEPSADRAPTPAPEPEVSFEPVADADEHEEAEAAAPRTYTVKSGDTLWKIAQQVYGDGSKYPVIFEANTPMLEDPDRIYPGQELVIPDLDED
ncbi:MAG: LysM peptidoglycan-binding domain-containing protein [Xanthomonadales bacterium]|nr:LysM peptidoglycan-binding domain-containing protein [Xanthomonadales bacterium]